MSHNVNSFGDKRVTKGLVTQSLVISAVVVDSSIAEHSQLLIRGTLNSYGSLY